MSSSKYLYSLPKTQPTLSSSSEQRLHTTKTKISHISLNPSPQVSAFTTDEKQQLYTHNMNIDYGKLSRPFNYEELKKSVKKDINIDLSQDLTLLLSTRKFKNLKQYTLNDSCNSAQKQGIEPPVHALLTQKKPFSIQKLSKPNPQSSNKPNQQKSKKRNRIISVKAYETPHVPFTTSYQDSIKQQVKKFSDTKQIKQKIMESDGIRTDRSDRKISHSRIIKTFNPTAGVQTKIITYPDLTEVFKIRESRKKTN